jgi:hypothetical protein
MPIGVQPSLRFAASAIALDTFKDPYLLDALGLHDGFLDSGWASRTGPI